MLINFCIIVYLFINLTISGGALCSGLRAMLKNIQFCVFQLQYFSGKARLTIFVYNLNSLEFATNKQGKFTYFLNNQVTYLNLRMI